MSRAPRTTPCTPFERAGRRAKAEQFWRAALVIEASDNAVPLGDAFITLCVHAGIAAADVLCCAYLGVHATGQFHDEAKQLLAKVDKRSSHHLGTLLAMKSFAGYSPQPSTADRRLRAKRATQALVDAARRV